MSIAENLQHVDNDAAIPGEIHDDAFRDTGAEVVAEAQEAPALFGADSEEIRVEVLEGTVRDLRDYYDLVSLIESKAVDVAKLRRLLSDYRSGRRQDTSRCQQKIQDAFMALNIDLE